MTNVYRDMQNVIVKVGSLIKSPHSLLINCHFDTVMNSPGASDDGAGCAVMMEILRVIAKSEKILRHNIIFLFNGGEENFMPASHGFITQHKWAKEIRAFINLEACGAGGREILFQAGPSHPWIMETYSEEVPYPFASTLAQEIFQSGVIPGDTDFRIFRDFGNLSGLDFAWSSNGYVYHSEYDSLEQIPLGSLQRTGDNILALAIGMTQGHQLSNVEQYKSGNLVFFDFLGAFVVRWSMGAADLINILSVIFSVYSLYTNAKRAEVSDYLSKKTYCRKVLGCVGCVVSSWISALLGCLAIAFFLNGFGVTMSWYANPVWIFFLYVIPTYIASILTIYLHASYFNKDLILSPWTLFQLYFDAYQLLWTICLALGVIARIRSSFIALIWVIAATVENLVKSYIYGKWRDSKWLLLHIGVMGLPFVQGFYLTISALYLFIPLTGRAGAGSYAEFLIAIMTSLQFCMLLCFAVPVILLVQKVKKVFSLLMGIFLVSIAVLLLTPLGFPYSGNPNSPAPQRFMIIHSERIYHDAQGRMNNRTYGYWIVDMDINSPHSVDNYVPEMKNAIAIDQDCHDYLYCGLPYLVPVLNMLRKTHWIAAPSPPKTMPLNMTLKNRENIPHGERLYIEIEGANHIGVMMSPVFGVTLKQWSLESKQPLAGPIWNGRNTYFIYYTYGLNPVPFNFYIDFEVPSNHSGPLMDFAVTTHHLFGKNKKSEPLEKIVQQFPSWTTVTAWTAIYKSWLI
ncbi:hypothetical protein HHI36_000864 [Cryptolaemus montrouzieri]|uniref:FXNA-like protease n=1 Tax=Cryptolaemus montrouzieri TaxID=559131 RepID=A0ABD2P5X7_9CUCU